MNRLDLVLHCGAEHVDENAVRNVATPEATKTHCPIPHHRFVDMVENTLGRGGFEVAHREHALSHEGQRYFGLFQINPAVGGDGASHTDDYATVIGLRNSHDKSFPAGGVCGSGVFVCDNLAFSGEVEIKRRHTRYIMNDLPGLVDGMVGKLLGLRRTQAQRIAAYKGKQISVVEAQSLVVDALRANVISTRGIPQVLKEWDEPSHEEFAADGRTVWRLFNAFTEALKDRGQLAQRPRFTLALHGLCDSVCGLDPVEDQLAVA